MHNVRYPQLQCHTEWFSCPKNPELDLFISPSPDSWQPLIFLLSSVLPFPECHVLGIFSLINMPLRWLHVFLWLDSCTFFFLFTCPLYVYGFPGGTVNKESACQCKRGKTCGFSLWVGMIPWKRKWQPVPVSLPGKFQGQRSLVGYSPWGHKELDTTETEHPCMCMDAPVSIHLLKGILFTSKFQQL